MYQIISCTEVLFYTVKFGLFQAVSKLVSICPMSVSILFSFEKSGLQTFPTNK